MTLEGFLDKNQLITIKNAEKQLAIKELIIHLETLGRITNSDRYYAQVIHRESLENTGIGRGVAIPHARTESVSDFITVFGISTDGIDYQSFDNIPVKYIMLSIFPTEMSTKYLYLVGMIAKIFSDDEKLKKIEEARTPAKIFALLNKEAKQHFADISQKSTFKNEDMEMLAGVPSSNLDLLIRLDRMYHIYDEGDKSESITKKILELKKLIDNKTLSYYEKMRQKCQNPFSIVERNTCTGCHMQIPPVLINQNIAKGRISLCTFCGRFLIFI